MAADLKDFFSAIGKAKKEKVDEVRSLVGEIDIDSMFSQVKVSIEEDNKKKEEQKKQVAALESWLYKEVVVKEEEEEIIEESTPIVVPHEEIEEEVEEEVEVVEEIEEIEEEVVEVEDDNTVDQALKILETIKSKEEIRENVSDPEIIKIRRELEYLKNLVNAQGGGGEVRLEFLDDVDRDSIKVDGKVLSYQASTGKFIGVTNSGEGGGGGLSNVVSDTTPQLGGNLDVNGKNINGTGGVNVTGVITATTFSGSAASLTSIPAGQLTGIISDDRLPSTITSDITGNVTGNTSGTAGGLTGSPSISVTNITASGNVSIAGTLTYEDVTNIDSIGIITARSGIEIGGPVILNLNTSTSTTESTSQSAVDTFSVTDYRSASYQVQITRGTEYHVTSLNIVHDGTNVYVSEFGTINTGSVLASFTADINSGSVRILATPTTTSSTVFKMYRNLIRA
jgi:hypothetical protein